VGIYTSSWGNKEKELIFLIDSDEPNLGVESAKREAELFMAFFLF
jgi:hypothetical protein